MLLRSNMSFCLEALSATSSPPSEQGQWVDTLLALSIDCCHKISHHHWRTHKNSLKPLWSFHPTLSVTNFLKAWFLMRVNLSQLGAQTAVRRGWARPKGLVKNEASNFQHSYFQYFCDVFCLVASTLLPFVAWLWCLSSSSRICVSIFSSTIMRSTWSDTDVNINVSAFAMMVARKCDFLCRCIRVIAALQTYWALPVWGHRTLCHLHASPGRKEASLPSHVSEGLRDTPTWWAASSHPAMNLGVPDTDCQKSPEKTGRFIQKWPQSFEI